MKKVAALLILALAATALVACGSSNDNSTSSTSESSGAAAGGGEKTSAGGGGGASTVKVEADPGGGLAYTPTSLSTKAGEVTVEFNNPQSLTHDVAIEDSSGKTIGKTELVANGSSTATVDLKPGKYTYFCTVPGHREAGMEGTLTVK